MITIVYASRALAEMDEDALIALLNVARARNESEDVTGLLVYAYRSFMQQLEGEEAAVDRIFASIKADPRHEDVRMLGRRPITERRFGTWSMGFEHPDTDALSERLPGYRAEVHSPLVSSELVTNFEIAETVLAAAGTSPTLNTI